MTGMIATPPQMPDVRAEAGMGEDDPAATPPPLDKLPQLSPAVELSMVQHVRELFYRARDQKRPIVQQWRKNYNILNISVNARRPGWEPAPEVPEIWPIIDAIVAWITDEEPTFDAAPVVDPLNPYYDTLIGLAQDLKSTIRAGWHVNKTDAEVEKVVWDALTYNIGYFKTVWDGSLYRGYGDATIKRLDPWKAYPDPDAATMEEINYFIEASTISKQELERRFPGALARMNGDGWQEDIDTAPNMLSQDASSMPRANSAAISPGTSPRYGLPGQDGRLSVSDDPGVTVFEAWLRTPKQNWDGNWYDSWKCVVMASDRILMDMWAEDMWEHGQHPYERYVAIESGEFYGVAMVQMLGRMQRSINKVLAAVERNIELIGNPVFLESTRAGISRTALTNKPGTRLSMNEGGEAKWMEPPTPYPNMATELVKFYIQEMERISGLSAVVRGASPSGRNAQGVIDSVQEAAFVRIRKALRNLSYTIGASGEKLASLIVEFYTEPRVISIIGPDGEKLTQFLKQNHFYLPTSNGPAPMRFQILIDSGANQSMSRDQRESTAKELFALGAIDDEALLSSMKYPEWAQIVQRQRELKAQQGALGQPPTQRAAARR